MAIQLTPEQEQRLNVVVRSGAYTSIDEALNAALAAIETAAHPVFEGREGELDELLAEGAASVGMTEEQFWRSFDQETNALVAAHKPPKT